MKRKIFFVCFIIIAMAVNAQHHSRSAFIAQNFARSMKMFQIEHNTNYYLNKSHTNNTDYDDEKSYKFLNNFVVFGFGVGGGTINPTGNLTHNSFDMDLIFMNILFSAKFGSFGDTDRGYDVSSSDVSSTQLGFFIPIYGFGDEDLFGRKHKTQIYISPLIEFISLENTTYDGEYMHKNTYYHTCSWWIDNSKTTEINFTEYGAALMVRHGFGYLLGKITSKSFGISVGLCL